VCSSDLVCACACVWNCVCVFGIYMWLIKNLSGEGEIFLISNSPLWAKVKGTSVGICFWKFNSIREFQWILVSKRDRGWLCFVCALYFKKYQCSPSMTSKWWQDFVDLTIPGFDSRNFYKSEHQSHYDSGVKCLNEQIMLIVRTKNGLKHSAEMCPFVSILWKNYKLLSERTDLLLNVTYVIIFSAYVVLCQLIYLQ